MKDVKLSSKGIWIKVGDEFVIKLAESGAAPLSDRWNYWREQEHREELAERIVACVNAFDGIETGRIAGKNLGEFLAGEVRLHKAEPHPDGGFGFSFSGFAVQLMAEAFAEQFKGSGAVNYLELLFQHKELGPLTVTMQRVAGLTPTKRLAQAEAQRDELLAALEFILDDCSRMVPKCAEEKARAAIARVKGATVSVAISETQEGE